MGFIELLLLALPVACCQRELEAESSCLVVLHEGGEMSEATNDPNREARGRFCGVSLFTSTAGDSAHHAGLWVHLQGASTASRCVSVLGRTQVPASGSQGANVVGWRISFGAGFSGTAPGPAAVGRGLVSPSSGQSWLSFTGTRREPSRSCAEARLRLL